MKCTKLSFEIKCENDEVAQKFADFIDGLIGKYMEPPGNHWSKIESHVPRATKVFEEKDLDLLTEKQ